VKADLLLLVAAACVAGAFAYGFAGGLTVRVVSSVAGPQTSEQTAILHVFWPIALPVALIVWLAIAGGKASQWRPKRKSALPGARVVR
jgi:hypothetical protein